MSLRFCKSSRFAKLIAAGVDPVTACRSPIAQALTDDSEMLSAVRELSASLF